ncbi:MAG TPA: hypothetical protein VK436_13665 [Methanocella sp.]|nr:hypothetical protein [Methanocella sp.]
MVQNTMSTAILIISTVIATVALITALYPTISGTARMILSSTADTDTRSTTMLTISSYSFINATTVDVWAKNTGRSRVSSADLQNMRAYYGDDSGSMASCNTSFLIEDPNNGDSYLDTGETLMVEITSGTLDGSLGVHRIRLVLPNGAITEYTMNIG